MGVKYISNFTNNEKSTTAVNYFSRMRINFLWGIRIMFCMLQIVDLDRPSDVLTNLTRVGDNIFC